MATIRFRIRRAQVGRITDPQAAADRIQTVLRDQRNQRFRTQGRSDGGKPWARHRHKPGASVLTDTGRLRDLVLFDVKKTQRSVIVTMYSAPQMQLIANVHQFGTKIGKDIKPVRTRALFIPMTFLGKRSELLGGIRQGVRGDRRGRQRRNVPLVAGKDFILRSRIPATAEKENRAIQPRPHFRVTRANVAELVENIIDSQIRR